MSGPLICLPQVSSKAQVWSGIKERDNLVASLTCSKCFTRGNSCLLQRHIVSGPTVQEWREDAGMLRAWQKGRTGYPLVDAGMRQLWLTGWMQQSIRMVCAAFLTELPQHPLDPWREVFAPLATVNCIIPLVLYTCEMPGMMHASASTHLQ